LCYKYHLLLGERLPGGGGGEVDFEIQGFQDSKIKSL
jgi:hypothetical protein